MAQKPTAKQGQYDIAELFKEIQGDSDRAAAITAVAYFEEILTLSLAARFVPLTTTKKRKLFDEREGALDTFYAKTQVGRAIGLYGAKTLNDLDLIRQIRNRFAHYPGISKFTHNRIKSRCEKLYTAKKVRPTKEPRDKNEDTPRALYLNSLLEIGARLLRSGPRSPNHLTRLANGLD